MWDKGIYVPKDRRLILHPPLQLKLNVDTRVQKDWFQYNFSLFRASGVSMVGDQRILVAEIRVVAVFNFTHAHSHKCIYFFFSVQVRFSTLHAPVHVHYNHLFHDVILCTQRNDKTNIFLLYLKQFCLYYCLRNLQWSFF